MENLGILDVYQIISVILAFVLGFLPNFITVKSETGITKKGVLLIFLFCFSVFVAVSTTILKSIDDTEKYHAIINSSEATLKNVNETLASSEKINSVATQSLDSLKTLQEKSTSLQNSSIILNQKLSREILIQQLTINIANGMVEKMNLQERKQKSQNQISLVKTLNNMGVMTLYLYSAFEEVKNNFPSNEKILQKREESISMKTQLYLQEHKNYLESLINSANTNTTQENINNVLNSSHNSFKKGVDSLINSELQHFNNYVDLLNDSIHNSIVISSLDSSVTKTVYFKEKSAGSFVIINIFLEKVNDYLSSELSNPELTHIGKFSQWCEYFNFISGCKQQLEMFGYKILTIKLINDIQNKHAEFLKGFLNYGAKLDF